MGKKCFVGCRVDQHLFNMVQTHEEQNSVIVRKALQNFFRELEQPGPIRDGHHELINVLNNQILDLKNDKQLLNDQIQMLMLSSFPLLARIKMKLLKG